MSNDFVSVPPYNVIQPGAYSAVNASLLASPSSGNGPPIPMVLGASLGGVPDVPLYFPSPAQLQQVTKGGVGYDVARFVFQGGAPIVGFTRVGNAVTQATGTIAGSGGTAITLTSKDYGSWNNSITITTATGPIITLNYTDALGNQYVETWNFTGVGGLTVATIVSAINGGVYGYNGSNYVTAAAGAGTLPLTNAGPTALSGGTDGSAPAAGDWTNGLTAIQTEPVDIIIPATSTASVHAQVLAHCQQMSQPGARYERVMYTGGALGESVSATIARIQALNSARVKLCYPGFYDSAANGALTEYDSFYTAGKVAGMACALPDPATSLVHKRIPMINAEVALSSMLGGSIDQLLYAGVTPIAPAPGGGFWIVDDLTGYNTSDQTFRDMTSTRSADYVAQFVRNQLENLFVGSKNLSTTSQAIQSAANAELTTLAGMNVIAAWQSAQVTTGPNPNSWNVMLPVQLVSTLKWIFITVMLQPAVVTATSVTAQNTVA